MAKSYKVWIQVEEFDDEIVHWQNITEPESIFETDSADEAQAFFENVIDKKSILAYKIQEE
jgi:hypothetical protein